MKLGRWAITLPAALLLAGCGDFWQAPSTTTTGSTGSSTLSSGNFYVMNAAANQVVGYSIVSGALTAITNGTATLTSTPASMAVSPNGSFLYVSLLGGAIYMYTIGSDGQLTLGNNGQAISGDPAATMQVDSTNSWLVVSFPTLSGIAVNAIPISSTTGLLRASTEVSLPLSATSVSQLAISPDNTHIFVALGSSGTEVLVFAAGDSDPFGNTAHIGVLNAAGADVSIAVDPTNRMVYIGETVAFTAGSNPGGLRAINYNTLAEVTGSPYATGGLAPSSILPTADGNYVYVANRTVSGISTGSIAGFSFVTSGTTYSLKALSGTAAGAGTTPAGLAEDTQGNYLLVVDSGGSPDLEAYTISSGVLTSVLSSATGTDPVGASAIAGAPAQ
jgi:6-phosphogluconolactonase (cycloisomerase 2 family)